MKLSIGHLYPEHLNLYGDRGNILALYQRATWRNIPVQIKPYSLGCSWGGLEECHLLFIGGGQDAQQFRVAKDLSNRKSQLSNLAQQGCVILGICGGYQLMGHYYKPHNGPELEGLGLLNAYTLAGHTRMIGNITIQRSDGSSIVGFENHSGQTFLGPDLLPLGTVLHGFGNNGQDKTEGAQCGSLYGSYLHGSLLPKNPQLTDELLLKALQYAGQPLTVLPPLDNATEYFATKAHEKVITHVG